MPGTTVRPALPSDTEALVRMANALNADHGKPPDVFSAQALGEDLFGARPACSALVAELGGDAVGYAFYHETYNSDLAARGTWLVDLYVAPESRGGGLGRALMAAVARETVRRGGRSLWWGVDSSNRRARDFYTRLGATDEDARILQLDDEHLTALAAEAPGYSA